MTAAVIERLGSVAVLRLTSEQNLWDSGFVADVGAALDEVEADGELNALVTVGAGKCYSNGFDLGHMLELDAGAPAFLDASLRLLGRLLTFPLPTVAAMNGHAFGIGAMFALAHDQRLIRADRGWFCLPEADLGIRFHPFMTALITRRLTDATALEAITTARRYDGPAAVAAGIAAGAHDQEALLDAAVALAAARAGKDPKMVATFKADMYADVLVALDAPAHVL
jgi:enoyl-CoA hydratase/carnithine racemase